MDLANLASIDLFRIINRLIGFVLIYIFSVRSVHFVDSMMDERRFSNTAVKLAVIVFSLANTFLFAYVESITFVNIVLVGALSLLFIFTWKPKPRQVIFAVSAFMETILVFFYYSSCIVCLLFNTDLTSTMTDLSFRGMTRGLTLVLLIVTIYFVDNKLSPSDVKIVSNNRTISKMMFMWMTACDILFIFQFGIFSKTDLRGWSLVVVNIVIPAMLLTVSWMLYVYNVKVINLLDVEKNARRDGLTGIYNRFAAQAMIDFRLNEGGALFIIDVDNFKAFNDSMGHATGDKVLTIIAEKMKSSFREEDIIGRYGGDEFFVFMRGSSDLDLISDRAEHLRSSVNAVKLRNESTELRLSVSIGIYIAESGKNEKFDTAFKKADEALYISKEEGKNTFTIFNEVKAKRAS